MKDNIIDITKILQANRVSWADGIDVLDSLEDKDAKAVVDFLLDYVSKEIEVGLGLAETSEDPGELQVFNRITSLYEKAAGGAMGSGGNEETQIEEHRQIEKEA